MTHTFLCVQEFLFYFSMLVKTYASAVCGIEAYTVTIETDVSPGINYCLVGLPDSAVRESQQRIATAVQAVGLRIPGKRITVNMAPADIRKEGSSFDLPLALSILAASQQIYAPFLEQCITMGELALDGSLRPIKGALSIALHARACGFKACVFPTASAYEAAVVDGIAIYGVDHLAQVLDVLAPCGDMLLKPLSPVDLATVPQEACPYDFAQVYGQEQAKRALEVAAAGGHNVLMSGPPGAGKTFMAKCIPGILPPLSKEESIETTRIYSAYGHSFGQQGLMAQRPFRSPHHTSSIVSLTGGGGNALPGEISLAHNGVLYLDELPEFSRAALEVLRQPMEDGTIHLARAQYHVEYPASFMLVASMNPCPCGFLGHPTKSCTCTEYQVQRYASRLSGPLLDRIDILLHVLPVKADDLFAATHHPRSSAQIRQAVERVRTCQRLRYAAFPGVHCNAQMRQAQLPLFCALSSPVAAFLKSALQRLQLSARAHHRILRLSRTIADLADSPAIEIAHIAEALQYR